MTALEFTVVVWALSVLAGFLGSLTGLGGGVVTSINRHAWLATLLAHRAALLRAPFLSHIILEDWLLESSQFAVRGSR